MRKNYFNSTTCYLRNLNCRLYVLLAIFVLGGSGIYSQGIWDAYVLLGPSSTVYFVGGSHTALPGDATLTSAIIGAQPAGGTYNLGGTNVFTYTGGSSGNICGGTLNYDVYSGSPGSFTAVNGTYNNGYGNVNAGGGSVNQEWSNSSNTANILSGLAPGSYNLNFYFSTTGGCGSNYYLNNGGSNYIYTFTVYPSISTVASNNSANNTGYTGSTLTITGVGFTGVTGASAVQIGGVNAASYIVNSNTQITAVVGAGASGSTIAITNNSQTGTASFTYLGYITQAPGNWSAGADWLGNGVAGITTPPPSGSIVTIANNITLDQAANVAAITINGSTTLTGSNGSAQTLTVAANGTFTDNGTFTPTTTGTVNFAGAGTLTGTASSITLNNLTINGVLTLSIAANINGSFVINSGHITAAPTYGSSSTLIYNNGGTFNAFSEWNVNTTTGAGVPANVTVGNGTASSALGFGNSAGVYTMTGNLHVSSYSGAALTLNSGGGTLAVGGNWADSGTFTSTGATVVFNSSTASQSIIKTGGESFTNLKIANTNSGVTMSGNVTVTSTLTMAGGYLDLEQNTLTVGNGTSIVINNSGVNTIQSTGGIGILALTTSGTTTVSQTSGTLATSSNVNITLGAELTISTASILTINGTLSLNSGTPGGYINSHPPIYGSGSTLVYNNGATYVATGEWTASTTPGTGVAGVPYSVQIGNGTSNSALSLGSGTYYMSGNLTFSNNTNATLTTTGTLNIGGNWVNNNTTTTTDFNGGTAAGTVVFFNGGAGAQTIGGNNSAANGYDFYNLTINNSSGVSLANSDPISVAHVLSVNSGLFTTTGGTLSVTATAAAAITTTGTFSNTLYINGPVTWALTTGTTYLFPVGNNNTYLPFGLTNVTGTSPAVTVQAVDASASGSPTFDATLVGISPNEYWKTSGTGFSTASTVSLTSAASVAGGYNTVAQSSGQSGPYTALGGSIAGNTITSVNSITSLGYFVMGQAPLPTVTGITYNSPTVTGQPANSVYYGQNITISGNYFSGVSSVYFGTTQVTSFTTGTGTVTLNVPVAPAGANQITVVGTYGTGPAYSISYLGYITDGHSSLDYNNAGGGAWLGCTAPPPASSTVTVNISGITISGASNSPTTLTITTAGTLNINNASGAVTTTTLINNGTLTISAAAASAVTATTLTNNGAITFSAAGTLAIASGGTLTNNGTFTAGNGTVTFTGNASTVAGAITFNNLTLNLSTGQGLTIPASPNVSIVGGILTMQGGHFNSAPVYTSSSTLLYSGSFTRYYEWTATTAGTIGSTVGYPNKVTVGSGTLTVYNSSLAGGGAMASDLNVNNSATMDFTGSNTTLTVAGNVNTNGTGYLNLNNLAAAVNIAGSLTNAGTVSLGSMTGSMTVTGNVTNNGTFSLSSSSGSDLIFGGNFSNTATYTDNGSATEFNGATNGTISSTGNLNLSYLQLGGAGNLQLGSGNITLVGTASQALQFLSTGALDLETYTLSMAANTSIQLNNNGAIQSTGGTGTLALAGELTVPNTGTNNLTTSLNVLITEAGDLNITTSSGLKVNGTLQINGGGYVGSNAPNYGSSSILVYNSVGNPYGNNNEWTGGGTLTVAAGIGVPANVILQGTGTNQVNLAGARGVPGYVTINSTSNTLNLSGDLYLGGNLTVNGPFATNSKAVWFTEGGAQSINSASYPNVTFDYILIDKTGNAVTLNIPIQVNQILTLSGGNINSTSTNVVNILNTGTGGIASGSTSSYINGPVNWTLPANPAGPYIFPVGDAVDNGGAYLPLSLANITSASGTVVQVQATNSGSGGSYNNTALASISSTEYWQVSQVSGTYTSASVSLTRQAALGSLNAIGWNNTGAGGQYAYEAGTVSGTSINNSNVVGAGYLVMAQELPAPVISSVTVGAALNGQGANTGYIGQTVTISGSNFSSNDGVTFNGTAPINVIITPPSTITAIVNLGTSISTGTVAVTDPATTLQGSAAFTNLGYISTASTDWNTNTTWLNGGSGATNFTGTSAIPVANSTVTIANTVGVSAAITNAPNVVTVASGGDLSFTGGSLTVNTTLTNGGTIDMTSGGTLTLGSGSTLTNNSTFTGGTGTVGFTAAGTINGTTAATLNNLNIGTGAVTLTEVPAVNGTLEITSSTGSVVGFPNYGSASTLIYNVNFTRGNEWSSQASTYPGYVIVQNTSLLHTGAPSGTSLNIGHDLTLGNGTGSGSLNMDNSAKPIIAGGNINIGGSSGTSTLTLSSANGGDIKLSGNWSLNANGSFAASTRSVFFTGGSAQTITGATTFDYINMDKTGNSNVTLNNSISVNHTIFLTDAGTGGSIITGSNVVAMATGAATSGASATSHIDGNESYAFTSGSLSFTYDIGDASVQAGANVTYSSISTGGTLTAFTTDGDHPQIATSGIYAPHSVNRYHTLTNSGIVGGSYNATFYFATSDLGAGSVTSDFAVMEYTGSVWNGTTTGTLTANSSQATGLTTYGAFQIGDLAPQGTFTSAGSICAGTTGQLVWTSTAGTGPFSVTYSDGSNHTATGVVSGTPFNIYSGPASTTTYTLISVTDAIGDVTTSGFTGGSATVTVIATTPSSVSINPSPTGAICQGQTVSFIASPTYGGTSPTYNFEVNGTSVQSGSSTVLTSNTINNNDVIKCLMTSNAVCPSPTTSTSNSITETVNPLPTVYNVTGGGNFCPGGSVAVGLSNSQTGVNYELKNGASDAAGPVAGNTGNSITFGNQSTAATYTVVATNGTTGCVNNMSGTAVVIVNPQAASPSISTPNTTVCSGSPVTFTASGGSQYGFNVNGTPVGSISATNTYTTSSLNNNDQVSVTSFTPFIFDGNITESAWGTPIQTSTGGPYDNAGTFFGGGPSFGAGHEINALYALSDANNINFAIAGNVQNGNRILLFIQSTTGGYNTGNFGRAGAPNGVIDFNSSSTFDFSPNYCLVIGTNSGQTDYFFDLYTLSGTAGSGGGPDTYLGDIATGPNAGAVLGANPANGTLTQGFEMAIPKSLLSYTGGTVKVMAMYISDGGFLSNQFLTHAAAGTGSFGSNAVNFTGNPGSFSIPSLNLDDNCSATSTPITMTIGSNLTPTISINASATTICTGTAVNFTSSITNGGTLPSYQWYKNSNPVGTNSSTYSDNALNNGDQIQCVLTSNASCVSTPTGTSNTITMIVNSSITPSVTIAANPSGAVCAGTNVTFSPTPTFGGTSPTYQWYDGVTLVGSATTFSSSSLSNGDVITCSMTSNAGCASPATVTSTNSITMSINPLPTVYSMTGGGAYCSGTSGVAIGLSNSQTNVNYQLYSGASTMGSSVAGNTGSAITFGNQATNGTDYNVIATTVAGCSAPMSGTETVYTNIAPAAPSIFASDNPICTGTSVSISAINGSLFQFFVNGNSQGAESTTDNFSSSSFNNGDQVTVTSYSSIVYDGNITEAIWGSPLATSAGGPSPGFGTGDEINAVYANGDGAHVNFAIAGNIQTGNRILLFIQSQASGGFNTANFSETNAPPGLNNFNQGTTFDAGFSPNYCLVIGANGSSDNYFDLFTLASTSSAGTDAYLGGRSIHNFGVQAGGNPAPGSNTQGFEISLPNSLLGYTPGNNIQVMGMVISEAGYLSNEFLTRANVSENNYGSGPIAFQSAAPNPLTISQYPLDNTCTATSTPITMSVSAQPVSGTLSNATPSVGAYCAGTELSATAAAGSGAPAGTATDVLQYSTNGGSSWTAYTSGNEINTSAITSVSSVEVETYRTSTVAGCTSSTPNAVTWTINPLPTIYNVTGGACAPVSIGLSNSQSGSNYVYELYVTNAGDSTALGSLTGTGSGLSYGDQVDAGIYNVVATNTSTGCAANMNGVSTVDFCTSTWMGTVDNNWTNQDNWNPAAVPNNCYVNVIINAGTPFSPTITGTDIYVRDMSIASGVTLTLAGNNLNVCGQWTGGSGTNAAVVGSGTVFINSPTVAQTISGNTQFNILQINNSQGVTASRSAIVAISTGLQLASGTLDVSIATLHLLSTASNNNSYIDDFSFGGNPGKINGSIIADRYVPVQGSNQHYISSPVSTPAFSQLNASGPDGSYIIPTATCDETYSAYISPYGTVFQYNDGHQPSGACMLGNWEIRSAGNTVNGQGYSAYLTGNSILSLTNTANTGNVNVTTYNSAYPAVPTLQQTADGGNGAIESGWALVGNPYPSALDLTDLTDRIAAGYDAQVQVWKTSGPFSGTWQATTITGESGVVVIPPFQAFMVHVTTGKAQGNYTYPFYQSERTRTTNLPFYRSQNQNTLQLTVDFNGVQDMTTVSFNPSATNGFDAEYDANKQDGSAGNPTLYTFFPGATTWYSINTVPSLTQTAAIPMGLRPNNTGTMTITPQGIESFDPTTYIYLEDKQTGIWTNLRNGSYSFTTTPTDNQQRFVLHFTPPAIILTEDASCDAPGMINIQQPGTANWNYTVTDVNNATVASGMLNAGAPVMVSVNTGIYTLTLVDNTGYTVVKSVQIGGVQPVSSAFTASATTAQVQQNITFNGTADNASVYDWDFGDGATANGPQAVHSYQSEGIYTAKLSVTGASGCISTTPQTITVTSKSVTGITNLSANKLNIWSYDNTVFVDFSNAGNVDAEVQLYNVLGQLLSDERFGKSTLYSKELTNLDAAYIIVKVVNDDQITTKKVFIANDK